MTACEFGVGIDERGFAIECGKPATSSNFAFCAAHLKGLTVTGRALLVSRTTAEATDK